MNVWNLRNYTCKKTVLTYEVLEAVLVIKSGSDFASCVGSLSQKRKETSVSSEIYFITVGERGVVRLWSSERYSFKYHIIALPRFDCLFVISFYHMYEETLVLTRREYRLGCNKWLLLTTCLNIINVSRKDDSELCVYFLSCFFFHKTYSVCVFTIICNVVLLLACHMISPSMHMMVNLFWHFSPCIMNVFTSKTTFSVQFACLSKSPQMFLPRWMNRTGASLLPSCCLQIEDCFVWQLISSLFFILQWKPWKAK